MRPKFFYGYVIIALCFANMVVMRGVNGAFGVYFLALLEEFPWSRSAGASIASANFFVYAIASPLVGLAFDRFGPRVLMPLGAFLTGLGLVLSSFAHSLGGLYFTYGIVTALGQGALSFVGHNALISFWFVRKRATAIGIASMGQGLGRAGHGAGDAIAGQLHRLALDLRRHRRSTAARLGSGQRFLSTPHAGGGRPVSRRRRRAVERRRRRPARRETSKASATGPSARRRVRFHSGASPSATWRSAPRCS